MSPRRSGEAPAGDPMLDRELSWLAFNHRVLQEAMDPEVPLFDRLGFLAIFSSNLDEFFRVRVAALRARMRSRSAPGPAGISPPELLRRIHRTVSEQQELFGATFREQIVPALAERGIRLVDERSLPEAVRPELRRVFEERVAGLVRPTVLRPDGSSFLRNRAIYLVVELLPREGEGSTEYGLVEIPSDRASRFVGIAAEDGTGYVVFLDDLLRMHLPELFPEHRTGRAFSVKMTRDAELYLEEELAGSVAEAVRRSLRKRDTGQPTRFLYDQSAPEALVAHLRASFGLADADLVRGGRYHNLHDLHDFPRFGRSDLSAEPMEPLAHPTLQHESSVLEAVERKDRVLHFPYQSYDYLLRFVREAADDPEVVEMWATLYRVAPRSAVVSALADAARAGKQVTVFIEVQARFDEAANLAWAEQLREAGARILFSLPGLKVHAKMILVGRGRDAARRRLCCLSTGNFNERSARVYADHALLTADPEITAEVEQVFRFLAGEVRRPETRTLLVAPFTLRSGVVERIEREREHAEAGRPARAILKMNSLEDPGLIQALYDASRVGVEVELLVRGICCLAAGVPGLSRNVRARSIVDRFLEHARVMLFHDGGREHCYLASADWMVRNMDHRVEVAFPVLDPDARAELLAVMRMQMDDDRKTRLLDSGMRNRYLGDGQPGEPGRRRAQIEIYRWLESLAAAHAAPATEAAETTLSAHLTGES